MRSRLGALSAACVLTWAASAAHADTMYVIEQLYVTVNGAADGSGDRVGQIKSGDRVEVLERQGDQAHVQLASGSEGWVNSSYLSSDPPLREQVEQLKKDKAQVEAELAKTKTALTAATAAARSVSREAPAPVAASPPAPTPAASSAPIAEAAPLPAQTESVAQSPPPLFQDEPFVPSRPSWLIALISVLAALGIGFAFGWRTLDKRIRAKYGGLRIY